MTDETSVNARSEKIATRAEGLRDRLIEGRRQLYMYPELSNREDRTSALVAQRLNSLGLDQVERGVGGYGVVGLLKGAKQGPVVAVRADMDALPIQDTNEVTYKSRVPGVKHACGHDVHTTIQLGVAEVLAQMRDNISGSIKFIFQPAEEGPPEGEEGGALLMIRQGAFDNPRPSAVFCLHVMPTIEVGQVGYNSGPVLASSDRLTITIHGKNAHAAFPLDGVDAITVAAESVIALRAIINRLADSLGPLLISIGSIHGGTRFNIIAKDVTLEGTVRALSEDARHRAELIIRETIEGIASSYGATSTVRFEELAPVAVNDPKLVDETLATLGRIVGEDNLIRHAPLMAADDFSRFQQLVPGFYFFLGTGNKAKGIISRVHTPEFDVDEESLVLGVNLMSNVLLDYLDNAAH